jgi:hypothetical protein
VSGPKISFYLRREIHEDTETFIFIVQSPVLVLFLAESTETETDGIPGYETAE